MITAIAVILILAYLVNVIYVLKKGSLALGLLFMGIVWAIVPYIGFQVIQDAAFTFPFAITAIAAMQSMACLKNLERPQPWLKYVVLVETALAAILVAYALVRYIQALGAAQKAEQKQ